MLTPNRSDSVAAVVVTRNRLTMLQECIAALRAQTAPPTEVFIVDNDSTDGTREWLSKETGVRVVLQDNLGGAGGFHTGIKTAFEQGHDWIWCMDDDGYPAPDCLERLLEANHGNLSIRAPLVLAREDARRLAFVLRVPDGSVLETPRQFENVARDGLLWNIGCPFNGLLIRRELIHAVGLPLEGMFLWGDESEYVFRARRAGYMMATVGAARFHHPFDRMVERSFRFFGRQLCVIHVDQPLRDYLAIRNRVYIYSRYLGMSVAMRYAARHALFYLRLRGLRGMVWALGAGWAGLRGDWRGHQRYVT